MYRHTIVKTKIIKCVAIVFQAFIANILSNKTKAVKCVALILISEYNIKVIKIHILKKLLLHRLQNKHTPKILNIFLSLYNKNIDEVITKPKVFMNIMIQTGKFLVCLLKNNAQDRYMKEEDYDSTDTFNSHDNFLCCFCIPA